LKSALDRLEGGYHRYYRLPTLPIAQRKLGLVIARHLRWHY
jgi:hypothetical protein